ncbi:hypothetical protein D3C73_1149610 [compost metagenome]
MIATTMMMRTGHLAMFQTVRNVSDIPIAPPTASATGPLSTSIPATNAAPTTETTVTANIVPRSLTKPRPSSTSYTRFIARLKAVVYPEADQSATRIPRISAKPAALD